MHPIYSEDSEVLPGVQSRPPADPVWSRTKPPSTPKRHITFTTCSLIEKRCQELCSSSYGQRHQHKKQQPRAVTYRGLSRELERLIERWAVYKDERWCCIYIIFFCRSVQSVPLSFPTGCSLYKWHPRCCWARIESSEKARLVIITGSPNFR